MTQRRQFLLAAIGGTLTIASARANRSLFGMMPNAMADEGATKSKGKAPNAALLADIAKSAAECIRTGETCAGHCQRELAEGNTSMANCDKKVHEMLALTRSMLSLAASGSALAIKLAPLCAEACKSCADACGEHRDHFAKGMHLECKECMEACEHCEKACRKLIA